MPKKIGSHTILVRVETADQDNMTKVAALDEAAGKRGLRGKRVTLSDVARDAIRAYCAKKLARKRPTNQAS